MKLFSTIIAFIALVALASAEEGALRNGRQLKSGKLGTKSPKATKGPKDTKGPKATKGPKDTKAPKKTKGPKDTKAPKRS